ncbi:LOG family protein [Haploplasma axanthum]|uniref:Cytokinin riboside 5'-monophosphate phosphoribohydrolase n=1 Tax=Haploplasma axanthum TaxID=29552 RepID=A0A449BEG4_HAPAX|nr:TIGR00730 family Rossman fold protein [Haploplasma axanthum]VEU80818.1 LOG family protein yvdD [Haploplasma axanthum]
MKIAVYCGANSGDNEIYAKKAFELGKWIGENNHTLVYGGGKRGLMGLIAKTVLEYGGLVIGIMPQFLIDKELAFKEITEFIIVDNMSIRKHKMFELSDAFIAMPGGAGTLEEITEVISWAGIGQNASPCILYNVNNFYKHLYEQYKVMTDTGFFSKETFDKILFSDNVKTINEFINNYEPPKFRTFK